MISICYNKTNYIHQFLKFILGMKLYMFRTVPLSIIMSIFYRTHSNGTCYHIEDEVI